MDSTAFEFNLEKKGRGRTFLSRPWSSRTFKLRLQTLEYYDGSVLKDTIQIADSTIVKIEPQDADRKLFPFKLITKENEVILLNAESDEQRSRVIDLLIAASTDANWHAALLKAEGMKKFNEFVLNDISSSDHTDEVLIDPQAFPKHGVRLDFIVNLLNYCNGKEIFQGMTTTEVCETVVKPLTKEKQASFCGLLLSQHSKHVDIANVFISHAWRYKFLDVIDAIVHHYELERKPFEDVILWFDLFSNNQHKAVEYDFYWWSHTFRSAIHEIDHTLMIFAPWNNPIPLTRAWCIWELYCTIDTNSHFAIALSDSEKKKFIEEIKENATDVINRMLAIIDSQNSSAFIKADEERIHQAVIDTIGFNTMNSLIFEKLREWVIWAAKHELDEIIISESLDILPRIELEFALSDLYLSQGNYSEALHYAQVALDHTKKHYPDDAVNQAASYDQIATIYFKQSLFEDAKTYYEQALEVFTAHYGENDIGTLKKKNNLAGVYFSLGNYSTAKPLYEYCYEQYKTLVGEDNSLTLSTGLNLINVYASLGEYGKAIDLASVTLRLQRQSLGNNHPETLGTMNNYANLLKYIGRYEEAETIIRECFEIRKTIFGIRHPHTIESMNGLGTLCLYTGEYEKAKAMFEELIPISIDVLGEENQITLTISKNIGLVYLNLLDYAKAELYYHEFLIKTRNMFGDYHIETLHCLSNLAKATEGVKKYSLAYAYHKQCVSYSEMLLGDEHPIVRNQFFPAYANFFRRMALMVDESLPEEVTVEDHEHPLKKLPSVYDGAYGCDICSITGYHIVYHCEECGYDVHPSCVVSNFLELITAHDAPPVNEVS